MGKVKTVLTQEMVRKAIQVVQELIKQGYDGIPDIIVNGNKWECTYNTNDLCYYNSGLCDLFKNITGIDIGVIHDDKYFKSFNPNHETYAGGWWFPRYEKKYLKRRLSILWEILEDMEAKNINPIK